jgi:NADP-dependent 3-hydroxy acid dehydrogenase YdfG
VLRVTQGLLPALEASGDGMVIVIGSIAGFEAYEGGAGYNAANHAVRAVRQVLRYELVGRPVRVCKIDPGMAETEFSIVRFGGRHRAGLQVYEGVTP